MNNIFFGGDFCVLVESTRGYIGAYFLSQCVNKSPYTQNPKTLYIVGFMYPHTLYIVVCTWYSLISQNLNFPKLCVIIWPSKGQTTGQQARQGLTPQRTADRAGATAPAGIAHLDRYSLESWKLQTDYVIPGQTMLCMG